MPTLQQRLNAQKRNAADKQKKIDENNLAIKKLQGENKALGTELSAIKDTIQSLEARILTDELSSRGIDFSVIAAEIKGGKFDNATPEAEEKPPDITELNSPDKTVDTYINSEDKTAENGVTINDKEEIPDETGDSRKAVGGS